MVAADYPRLPPNYAFDPASANRSAPITLTLLPGASVDPELALRAAIAVTLATHAGETVYTIAVRGGVISGTIDPSPVQLLGQVAQVEPADKSAQHRLRLVYNDMKTASATGATEEGVKQDSALLAVAEWSEEGHASVISLTLKYDTRLIPNLEAKWLLSHIKVAFDALVASSNSAPSTLTGLSLLRPSREELTTLTQVGTSQPPTSTYPPECTTLHSFFINTATQYPNQPALVFDNSLTLTYSQLLTLASHLTTHLLDLGTISPGQVIPLCIDKRPEMVIGMLAILLSGCSYVNLEPSWPTGRKETIVQEASEHGLLEPGVALVGGAGEGGAWRSWGGKWLRHVVDPIEVVRPLLERLETLEEVDRSGWAPAKPSDPAYLVYTSGSTGAPKGIVVEHRNVAAFLSNYRGVFGREVGERVLQFPSYAFDVMVVSIWDTFAVSSPIEPELPTGTTLHSVR